MKEIRKTYTTVSAIQVSITFFSLFVSSLGVVIKHPFLAYFWYLALGGMATILATSFVIGILVVINRIFHQDPSPGGSRGSHGWFPRPKEHGHGSLRFPIS